MNHDDIGKELRYTACHDEQAFCWAVAGCGDNGVAAGDAAQGAHGASQSQRMTLKIVRSNLTQRRQVAKTVLIFFAPVRHKSLIYDLIPHRF
jgi:hypothetical protein